jgi:hypothetical protein
MEKMKTKLKLDFGLKKAGKSIKMPKWNQMKI